MTEFASTIGEIDAVFATFARERPDALFVAGDAFFGSRAVQFATSTAANKIPATYSQRDFVPAGGQMSYGTDIGDNFHQVGVYTGQILKGTKPADLPALPDGDLRQINKETLAAANCVADVPVRGPGGNRASAHSAASDRGRGACPEARHLRGLKVDADLM